MRFRVSLLIITLLAATAAVTGCVAATGTVTPVLPDPTVAPTITSTRTVPSSWHVAPQADGSCPTAGATATFTQVAWDDFLTSVATSLGLPSPWSATLSGIDLRFPAGCYYMDGNVTFDQKRSLTDFNIDGAYTGNTTQSPKFVQLNTPSCSTGPTMMWLTGANTLRVAMSGLTLIGSAPDDMPYCPSSPGGIKVAGASGTTGPRHITIAGNSISNVWGDALYIGIVDHLTASGNTLRHAGRHSLGQTGGNDVVIRNNHLAYAASALIDIETNPSSVNIDRVLLEGNDVSYGYTVGTGTYQNQGLLLDVLSSNATAISDVTFRNNSSVTALTLWVQSSGSTPGLVHRLALQSNHTTGTAGGLRVVAGDNLTVTGNQVLGGPPVALWNGDRSLWFTNPQPTLSVGVPAIYPTNVCGTASGNTYADGLGGTVAMPITAQAVNTATNGYSMPAC